MRKQKYYLYLDSTETSVILHSLIKMKNTLTQQRRYTDCIDELIIKLHEAPVKRVSA